MKHFKRIQFLFAAAAVAAGLGVTSLHADDANAQDKSAIAASGEAFLQAFDKGDAAAVADFWLPDGDYVDVDGHAFHGRKEIQKLFENFFSAGPGRTLRVDSDSLRFLTPDTAIEDGTTSVVGADGQPPSRARYTNVFVKRDGHWLLASVREAPFVAPDRSQELGGLKPLLGEWMAQPDAGVTIRITTAPAPGGNFVLITRTVFHQDMPVSGGTEWIAWDPAGKSIRSWSFESDGGFSQSGWQQAGTKWTVTTQATLRDGRKVEQTHEIVPAADGTLTVSTTEISLNQQKQPTPQPLTFKRVN